MNVVIAGGSGLIGRALTERLLADQHSVVILSRTSAPASNPRVRRVGWKPDGGVGAWVEEIAGADAVVNLAGAGIADRRWTPDQKTELRSSRIMPTRSLVAAVRQARRRPVVFIQGSAVGFYGTDDGTRDVDESSPPGSDFLADLCQAWEAEALPAAEFGCRLVTLRTGVVLSADGGVLSRLRLPFLLFAGGPISSGRQYISWVHEADFISMVAWALANPAVHGVFNATSPEPVTNARFSAALGRALHRPSLMPLPAFALRLVYGEMAQVMLIEGQRVVPRRAIEMGFTFRYPRIEDAVTAAIASAS